MNRQIDQLVRLVDDLLDLNRMTHGRIALHRERVALTDLLRQVVQTVQPLAQSRRHGLELVLPDASFLVDADPQRLAQVFANLLNNAVKYTDPGGYIRVGVEPEGGAVVVTIADNGVGIPAALLPQVFDLFVQDPSLMEQGHGGLGIGLHIVQRLVAMHDGQVEAHSAGRGQGSTFRVRLPLAQPATSTAGTAVADTRCDPVAKLRRILVVDDDHDTGFEAQRNRKPG
jgi:signal transduction histidine kinase